MDWSTGISLKRSKYGNEIGGKFTMDELYEKVGTVKNLLAEVFKDILESDYEFKEYATRNELSGSIDRVLEALHRLEDKLDRALNQRKLDE